MIKRTFYDEQKDPNYLGSKSRRILKVAFKLTMLTFRFYKNIIYLCKIQICLKNVLVKIRNSNV